MVYNEQNNVPVGDASNAKRTAGQPLSEADRTLKRFYLEQASMLCPIVSQKGSETMCLWALLRKTKRIIGLLTFFDRPWEEGMPEIQRACLSFMVMEDVPQKERLQTLEKWGDWTTFLVGASRYRSFTTQLLQYYHRQLHDLEHLLQIRTDGER